MTIKQIYNRLDVAFIALLTLLAISVSGALAMVNAVDTTAKQPGPPYSSAMSVRDDGCYSSLSTASSLAGPFGGLSFGLVNAIVNVPVYDWDQTPNSGLAGAAYVANSTVGNGGLRGDTTGRTVGYAKDFDFKVTPIPNFQWMTKYLAQQLPFDIGMIGSFVGGVNPVPEPSPRIANPFIYQQTALIDAAGLPQVQLFSGALTQTNTGGFLNPNNILSIGDSTNYLLKNNQSFVQDLRNFNISAINGPMNTLVNTLFDTPPLSLAAYQYSIRGAVANDNCYESLTSNNKVPSYAFSVVDTAIPVTVPGWLYSPITLFDGKGISSSGVTFYPPGSVNGKAMLDCYGRGITPIVTLSGRWKLRDYTIGYGGGTGAALLSFGEGFATYLLNVGIANAIVAAGVAADVGAPGSGSSIASAALNVPAVTTKFEDYTSGFAFLFRLNKGSIVLPSNLSNRVIDYNKSKLFDINYKYLVGGKGHSESQNGKQFNPDLYIVLKKPYELSPNIDMDTADYHRTPDGSDIKVDISTNKTGFNKGNNQTTDVYRPQTNPDKGGPTYDDNEGPNGRPFSQGSVYRIEMKPGVIPNAIDYDRVNSGTPTYYTGVGPSSNVCSYLNQKLRDGDTTAQPSPLTGSNANTGRPEYAQPNAVDCKLYTGPTDIRMNENVGGPLALASFTEKIPAETPPGTKICFAVYYNSFGNDIKYQGQPWWNGTQYNYNRNYSALADKTYLSRAKCIVAGYKPSLQVRGGDMIVNGGAYTGTNTKEFLASQATPKEKRTYGSWVEYGVIASGGITGIGSGGTYRLGLPKTLQELGYLTFANGRSTDNNSDYGKYTLTSNRLNDGFDRVIRQFAASSDSADMSRANDTAIDVANLASGVYKLKAGATVDISASRQLDAKKSIILLAQKDTIVNVASDLRIPEQYQSIGDISQIVIAPSTQGDKYTININSGVSHVDAWLMNPNGSINTCRIANVATTDIQYVPRSKGPCDNTLLVNGPVSADLLYLRRNGGKDQSDDPNQVLQSKPGENLNLRPDAYLWAASHVDNASSKYTTTNSIDLPPRY